MLAFESGHAHGMLLNFVFQLLDALRSHVRLYRLARGNLLVTVLDLLPLHLDLHGRAELLSAGAFFLGDLLRHFDSFTSGNDGVCLLVDDFFCAD